MKIVDRTPCKDQFVLCVRSRPSLAQPFAALT